MSKTLKTTNGAAAAEDQNLPVVLFFRNPDYLGSTKVATGDFICYSDWLPGTCMSEPIKYTADLYHHRWKSGDFYDWTTFTPDKPGYPDRYAVNRGGRKHRSLATALKAAKRKGIFVTLTK